MLQKVKSCNLTFFSKRPDTWLPQSLAGEYLCFSSTFGPAAPLTLKEPELGDSHSSPLAGAGQGQWRKSLRHLGGSGELKMLINAEKVTSHPHRTWSAVPDALLGMIR